MSYCPWDCWRQLLRPDWRISIREHLQAPPSSLKVDTLHKEERGDMLTAYALVLELALRTRLPSEALRLESKASWRLLRLHLLVKGH